MELLVQKYLLTKTLAELEKEHGVYSSFNKTGHYFSLNYDMIESKENDPLSQECRGLILSKINGSSFLPDAQLNGTKTIYNHLCPGPTRVLCFGMKRFFNYGQGACAPINWGDPNLKILEKMDGTLCQVWHNPFSNQWNVATRSCPEADLLMDNKIFTFRTLFEKALFDTCGKSFTEFTNQLNTRITYCFELTTPYNRIVVNYPDCRITLLAARTLYGDLKEFDFSNLGGMGWVKYDNLNDKDKEHLISLGHDAKDTPEAFVAKPYDLAGVPVVKAYTYTTIDELLTWVSSLSPTDHEGVVVCDSQFNRIKVKNAAYCAANKLRDTLGTSPRNCLELILLNKHDDAISFLPQEIVNNLLSIKDKFVLWLKEQESLAQTIIGEASSIAPDKKTFALTVQKHKPDMPAALFAIYDNKANSVRSFIDNNRKDGTFSSGFIDKILSVI